MALVVICGLPCSGKSTFSGRLLDRMSATSAPTVIDEPSLHLNRDESYRDATAEKRTRGQLKAAVDRALAKGRIVFLDSINSIKGYRYEIWCLARAAGVKYCLVHCITPAATAQQWNRARQASSYSEAVFSDLAGRFESPDSKNRWEQPLFSVLPCGDDADTEASLQAICAWCGNDRSISGIPFAKPLQPTSATTTTSLSHTNLLAELDRSAQEVIDVIFETQARSGPTNGPFVVELAGLAYPVTLPRHLSMPEMRRQKRAFVKLSTQNTYSRLSHTGSSKQMFIDFLQDAIG